MPGSGARSRGLRHAARTLSTLASRIAPGRQASREGGEPLARLAGRQGILQRMHLCGRGGRVRTDATPAWRDGAHGERKRWGRHLECRRRIRPTRPTPRPAAARAPRGLASPAQRWGGNGVSCQRREVRRQQLTRGGAAAAAEATIAAQRGMAAQSEQVPSAATHRCEGLLLHGGVRSGTAGLSAMKTFARRPEWSAATGNDPLCVSPTSPTHLPHDLSRPLLSLRSTTPGAGSLRRCGVRVGGRPRCKPPASQQPGRGRAEAWLRSFCDGWLKLDKRKTVAHARTDEIVASATHPRCQIATVGFSVFAVTVFRRM